MAAVLILTPILFPSPVPAPGSKTAVTDSASTTPAVADPAAAVAVASVVASAGAAAPGMSAVPDSVNAAPQPVVMPIDTAVVTTAPAVFRTTNRGAALIGVEMQQYVALSNKGRTKGGPVELAKAGDRLLSFRLVTPGDTVALNAQTFTSTRSEENGRAVVRYDATVGARAITIAYSFLPDSYRVNVSAVVKRYVPATAAPAAAAPVKRQTLPQKAAATFKAAAGTDDIPFAWLVALVASVLGGAA